MASKTTAHVTIDLSDVRKAGSVEKAILAWAAESDTTSAGVVGSSFSTSGPGSGWSVGHNALDYARRAFEGGAMYYLDEADGRLAAAVPVTCDDEEAAAEDRVYTGPDGTEYGDDEVTYDGSGGYVLLDPEWTDESVVRLECPDVEDAIEHTAAAAEMARAVIDTHGSCSDRAAWKKLIESIRAAAEELDGVDADDLDAE